MNNGNSDRTQQRTQLLRADEVAAMLSISTRTLWRLVSTQQCPQPVRLGKSTRWRVSDVENWIERGCSAEGRQ